MKAVILAAGFGTRFRPVTHAMPKPMIPVLNRPLLGWAVEACIASGFREMFVNLHHIPEPIRTYLQTEFGERASFEFSHEDEILGTGGALRKIGTALGDEFVLMNGDTIQTPPFGDLVRLRRERDALACLLLRTPPEGESFTRVWLEDGRITGFGEGTGEALMFAGAHAISRHILDLLPDRPFSGLTEDVYLPRVADGTEVLAGHHSDDGVWFDVGKPERYMSATAGLLAAMDRGEVAPPAGSVLDHGRGSLRHGSASVDGEIERSSVGAEVRVGRGSRMKESVVWDHVTIGPSCQLERVIVAGQVELPEGTRAENVLVVAPTPEGRADDSVEDRGEWLVRPIDASLDWIFEAG